MERSLNFIENKGMGDTRRYDRTKIKNINIPGLANNLAMMGMPSGELYNIRGIDPINMAFAGVGNPIKLSVCLVSILNFASRNAENTGIRNAIKGM